MRCPMCKSEKVKTSNSRAKPEINGVKRTKDCLACGHRWTTVELHTDTFLYFERLQQQVQEYERRFSNTGQGWNYAWTDAEDALLTELYFTGAKYKDIAKQVGRPYKGVEMRIIKLRKEGKL